MADPEGVALGDGVADPLGLGVVEGEGAGAPVRLGEGLGLPMDPSSDDVAEEGHAMSAEATTRQDARATAGPRPVIRASWVGMRGLMRSLRRCDRVSRFPGTGPGDDSASDAEAGESGSAS
ncbi:MAG TPA: hypothetical protein DCQ36_04240 [Actinobacteria bacterium]|nr:hypothetical protein [Actinomycetota bacterium]